eukprot:TRINITY_DN104_c4_g1_i1.p1 TRINITY_DN104_c4_g1~~TRINITY_DN104_c4_g1_i1.p1  ORF type:complete len:725 (+),score=270.14 TRINITY_DN104_c4_g1_i1:48-2222(+)
MGYIIVGLWLITSCLAPFFFIFDCVYGLLSFYECLFIGIISGCIVGSWLTYFIAGIFGGLGTFVILVALSLQFAACFFQLSRIDKLKRLLAEPKLTRSQRVLQKLNLLFQVWRRESRQPNMIGLHLIIIFSFILFSHLFDSHTLQKHGLNYYSAGATWSDMSFHLQLINSFVYNENKYISLFSLPKSPIFAGFQLSYPFLPDFHCAILLSAGISVRESIIFPGVILACTTLSLLYLFNLRFTGSSFAAFSSVILTICCGGVGGFSWIRNGHPLHEIHYRDYIQSFFSPDFSSRRELFWFSFLGHVMMPQRSSLYVFPMALSIFLMLIVATTSKSLPEILKLETFITIGLKEQRLLYLFSGILAGLAPMVQGHAFIGICIFAAILALIEVYKIFSIGVSSAKKVEKTIGNFLSQRKLLINIQPFESQYVQNWLIFGIPLLLLAVPQLMLFVGRVQSSSNFLVLKQIWGNSHSIIGLWYDALFLLPFLGIFAFESLTWSQRKIYICFWAIFIVCNRVIFTPWEKDNIKVFYLWIFGLTGAISLLLGRILFQLIQLKSIRITAIIFIISLYSALMLSGGLSSVAESMPGSTFIDEADVLAAEFVNQNTEHDAVFLISDAHINAVSTVGGKTSFLGYAGWVSSHGYPWSERYWTRNTIMSGRDIRETIKKIKQTNISYVALDPRSLREFNIDVDTHPVWSKMKKIYDRKHAIFDVRPQTLAKIEETLN